MTTTQTTKTEAGFEISLTAHERHEDFVGIIERNADRWLVIVGRRDINGYFHPSYRGSRQFKSFDRSVAFASSAITERLNGSRENRGTLCADDIIRSGATLAAHDEHLRLSRQDHMAKTTRATLKQIEKMERDDLLHSASDLRRQASRARWLGLRALSSELAARADRCERRASGTM